jgi:prephenate dehydrogenase
MRVGILGSGLIGGKLGTIFARAGHGVVFSYAHSQSKLQGGRSVLQNAQELPETPPVAFPSSPRF